MQTCIADIEQKPVLYEELPESVLSESLMEANIDSSTWDILCSLLSSCHGIGRSVVLQQALAAPASARSEQKGNRLLQIKQQYDPDMEPTCCRQ
jgi:hypothetical protein